ncbi:MAG TPA: hypothetical protein VK897_18255 [Anaerolineales bacterium]|nr:hypothetical protein [Anaerolineales bacterium]
MHKSINIAARRIEGLMVSFFSLIFVIWSSKFIYSTSFVAIDGRRYFCLFDDAMISMRYAWNLSHGTGLVWNSGEYVQGYTNLLMTLLMSLITSIFDKTMAVLFIQVLGVGFMLAIAYISMKIADHIVLEDHKSEYQKALIRILAFAFSLLYYPLAYWSIMGMETGVLTLLLLTGILYAFNYVKSRRYKDIFLTAGCLGLAFITRNDSLIFAVLIGLFIFWEVIRDKTGRGVYFKLTLAFMIYVAFVAGLLLFQWFYYGELMPNTYVLKLTGLSLAARVSDGLRFILPFLIQISFLLIPGTLITYHRFQKRKLLFLLLVFSSIAYEIYVGGDPWNYWRIMSPTIPLLGLLFLSAVDHGIQAQSKRQNSWTMLLSTRSYSLQMCLVTLLGILVANAYFLPEILFLERPFQVSANQHNVNIALAVSEVTAMDASVGVFWAGSIPYFAERKGIDFLGKSDRYIAHLPPDFLGRIGFFEMRSPPGHNKYDLNYSIRLLQPTYIQGFKWRNQDLSNWVKSRYVEVEYKGIQLLLLQNSPAVLWEKLDNSFEFSDQDEAEN